MADNARRIERSPNFSDTMSEMIRTALRLTADRGGQLPSIAVLAHAMKMNRTTAYYYFQSPGALRGAVSAWMVAKLIECLALPNLMPDCMGDLIQLVMDNPYGMSMLLDDLLVPPSDGSDVGWWSDLVDAMQHALKRAYPGIMADAEVHVAWLLAGAFLGPRILQQRSTRDSSQAQIIERFRGEERRLIPCALAA